MLKLFGSDNHSVLGIDISATSVKVIELSGSDTSQHVVDYGSEPIAADAVDGHIIKDVAGVAHAIRQLVARCGFKTRKAVVAVRDSAIISKVIQVNEGLSDAEMEEMVIMDADKYIPYPIEEVNMDFSVIGPTAKNPSKIDVLIVASRSENVNSRVEALTKAGLQVKIVDVESYAIERAVRLLVNDLPNQGNGKIVAVMDVGAILSNLCVLQDMKMIFTREEEFGGEQLIRDIAQHSSVNFEEATRMLHDSEFPDDYEAAVLNPYLDLLILQIKRSLQFFYSTSHCEYIDHLLLAGGVTRVPDLAKRVQENLKISTSIADPFKYLSLPPKLENSNGASLMIACGLALRGAC